MYQSTTYHHKNQTISLPASLVWGEQTRVEREVEEIMQSGNHPGDLAIAATDEIARLRQEKAQLQERIELAQSLLLAANLRVAQLTKQADVLTACLDDYRKTVTGQAEQIATLCHYSQ